MTRRPGPRHRARDRGRGRRGEAGASLVEFALILPVFAMVMLATLTGGIAYNRKLATTAAAREGVRYAATLPAPPTASIPDEGTWAGRVLAVVIAGADGELDLGDADRYVCVARIPASGSPIRHVYTTSNTGIASSQACFADGLVSGEARVQVVTRRSTTFEAMVFSQNVDLQFEAVARYEAG